MIQIFGTRKCKDTQKALRFFKERGIKVQFIDLAEKGMSPGELRDVSRSVPMTELIDRNSKEFERRNLKYIEHDIEAMLLSAPLLFKTPVVRCRGKAVAGNSVEIWKEYAGTKQH
jgi:arsenate reductase (glutaredoxin)